MPLPVPPPVPSGVISRVSWRTSLSGFQDLDFEVNPDDPACIQKLRKVAADSDAFSEKRYQAIGYLIAVHNQRKIDTAELIQSFEVIARASDKPKQSQSRRDALCAIALLRDIESYQVHPLAVGKLIELAKDPGFLEAHRDVLAALAMIHDPAVLDLLAGGLVEFGGWDLADGVNRITVPWREKVDLFIRTLQSSSRARNQLDINGILQALSSRDKPASFRLELEDAFIEAARNPNNQDVRMSGILAGMLIASEAGDTEQAGNRINAYQRDHKVPESELHNLRLQVGGTAISGILQSNLKEFFQKPVHDLNDYTLDWWKKALGNARVGFMVRLWMSLTVFAVGVALLGFSSYRLLFTDLANKGLEALAPFAAGLGTMLLIVYAGPLKDIRQSVSDLATANAVFIAYVHRILEASHTFSYYYLNEKISFDDMAKSGALIKEAMESTVRSLNMTAIDSSEDVIVRAMNFAMDKMKR